jgi:hypothetical protein
MLTPSTKAVGILALLTLFTDARSSDLERALQDTATHINKTSPRPIGNDASLVGAVAYEKTLKYKFTFHKLTKEEISSQFALKQTEFLTDFVCTSPEMKVFVDNGVTLKYAYYDKHGQVVVIITVDTRTCGLE